MFRYCVNSSSLDFEAETEVDGSVKKEEAEEIHCPATMGGCNPDGTCSLRPKQEVRDRIEVRAGMLERQNSASNQFGLQWNSLETLEF